MSETAVAVGAWEALFRAQVSIMRELNAAFPTDDISFNEYDVLFNLSSQPERRARIRDLTRHLLLTQPSISRLVDRLASKGVVEKQTDPGDGRGIIVALTDHGYDLYRRTAVDHAAAIRRRVGGSLDHDELVALTDLCTRLRLGETTGSPGDPGATTRADAEVGAAS
ncbi:winged helix-turn-helix transcriptional regulator [Frigoribacterium sp. CFBP 8754]|uniref:MarR family winged helix-turn-helix transcriptional regulator n=1 Tax=unclassified Frigoribacterium TaxID=2627005 RepID=UPI001782D82F|nr:MULTISPECIES: MarR family winged helix-turn-helix transcriptional regulator [unclassified Frigoribacterium]MBD8658814.1 winged helix-turn-helix transcriptional regulator [Frigoribacterium sp. CFBP 8754]MBD8727111.1 winged helix-turn-helix transcriptional regulator [Frigoribacterium sp. CFBP 13707]